MTDCHEKIYRGMDWLCDQHTSYRYTDENGNVVSSSEEWDEETQIDDEGCGLYFCEKHQYETEKHTDDIQPKPDSPRWLWWIVNEDSWAKWREENPEELARYREQIKDFEPDAELLRELEFERAN